MILLLKANVILLIIISCNSYILTSQQITSARLIPIASIDRMIALGSHNQFSLLLLSVTRSNLTCQRKVDYLTMCSGRIKLFQAIKLQQIRRSEQRAENLVGTVALYNNNIKQFQSYVDLLDIKNLITKFQQKLDKAEQIIGQRNKISTEITDKQTVKSNYWNAMVKLRQQLQRKSRQKITLKSKILQQQAIIADYQKKIQQSQKRITDNSLYINQLVQAQNVTRQFLKEIENDTHTVYLEIEELRFQNDNVQLEIKGIQSQLSMLQQQIKSSNARKSSYKKKMLNLSKQIKNLNGEDIQSQISTIKQTLLNVEIIANSISSTTTKQQFDCSGSIPKRCTNYQTFLPCIQMNREGMTAYMKNIYHSTVTLGGNLFRIREINLFSNQWSSKFGSPYVSNSTSSCPASKNLAYKIGVISSIHQQIITLNNGIVYLTPCTKIQAISFLQIPIAGAKAYLVGFISTDSRFVVLRMAFQ